jgi:5S rRNA maturation endonuclease (ribonuclease M5)
MKKPAPQIDDFKKILVVEGHSDLRFYAEMLEHLGKHKEVFIEDMHGRRLLTQKLEAFLNLKLLQEKTHIAVIVDADENGAGIADSLSGRLEKLSGQKLTEGVWSSGSPKIGFFVVPSPEEKGEVEDLAWKALNAEKVPSELTGAVNRFVDETLQIYPAITSRIAKRRMGSLLAVRHEDDPRLGPAAQAKLIDFDAPAMSRLKTFLQNF